MKLRELLLELESDKMKDKQESDLFADGNGGLSHHSNYTGFEKPQRAKAIKDLKKKSKELNDYLQAKNKAIYNKGEKEELITVKKYLKPLQREFDIAFKSKDYEEALIQLKAILILISDLDIDFVSFEKSYLKSNINSELKTIIKYVSDNIDDKDIIHSRFKTELYMFSRMFKEYNNPAFRSIKAQSNRLEKVL